MAAPSPDPDASNGSDTGGSPPATPRWVKVSAIVAVVLAVLVVVMLLLGHGPTQRLRCRGRGELTNRPCGEPPRAR